MTPIREVVTRRGNRYRLSEPWGVLVKWNDRLRYWQTCTGVPEDELDAINALGDDGRDA